MRYVWSHPPEIGNTPGWRGDAGALLGWARWTVDGLHYLGDLDAVVEVKEPQDSHAWHVVDLAHAQWAASSAVGAIDLCAAALSRRLGIGPKKTRRGDEHEFDLGQLKIAADGGLITGAAAAWAQQVNADPNVQLLTAVRHPTTHSRLKRHFYRGGGGSERTHLIVEDLNAQPLEVGEIVVLARDTATSIIEDFFDRITNGQL